MSRSVREIYESMLQDKETRRELDVLNSTSGASVWRLLLWIVASGVYATEVMWDVFRMEVEELVSREHPHSARWYAEKAKQYLRGMTLPEGSDEYDVSGLSEEEIEEKRVVKYAAAIESSDLSILYVKVAGEDADGERVPLSSLTEVSVRAYLNEIRDVGVRIVVVNKAADEYRCELRVLYDPILEPGIVRERVDAAVREHVRMLPFNGEFSDMSLTDAIQGVEGVKIVAIRQSQVRTAESQMWRGVDIRYTPSAGYMRVDRVEIELEAYSVYESL